MTNKYEFITYITGLFTVSFWAYEIHGAKIKLIDNVL